MKSITKNQKKIISLFLTFLTLLNFTFSSTYAKSLSSSKKDILTTFTERTPNADWGSNDIHYLDKHNIKCKTNQALQGFRLFRASSNKLSYKFACKANGEFITGKTYEDKTPKNVTNMFKNISANYLDRHNVQCKKGYALQEFKLNSSGGDIFYSYRCVEVTCGETLTKKTDKTKGPFPAISFAVLMIEALSGTDLVG